MQHNRKCSRALFVGKNCPNSEDFNANDYATCSQLNHILSEMTRTFLRKSGLTPAQTLAQFFAQFSKGEHVLLKSYHSFSKSTMNKMCFLANFIQIFEVEANARNGLDYFQLFRLLCSDFPREIVQKSVNLLLPEQNAQSCMYKIVNSKKFIYCIYQMFIHADYFSSMLHDLFEDSFHQKNSFETIYAWLVQQDTKMQQDFQKPSFGIMVQVLLNLMNQRGLLGSNSNLLFIVCENAQEFIQQKSAQLSKDSPLNADFLSILNELISWPEAISEVERCLEMFENSSSWTNEIHKNLSIKEAAETPLNVKKKGGKK